jgi:hypothetical protein
MKLQFLLAGILAIGLFASAPDAIAHGGFGGGGGPDLCQSIRHRLGVLPVLTITLPGTSDLAIGLDARVSEGSSLCLLNPFILSHLQCAPHFGDSRTTYFAFLSVGA